MSPTTTGAIWIVLGTSLIALGDNFVARLGGEMGLWQFHILRSSMVVPVAALFAVLTGQGRTLHPRSPRHMAVRSLCGMAGLMLYFAALPAVGIAQTAAGFFTAPIWVAVISALVFGERAGPRRLLAAAIGFAGVCLVLEVGARPVEAVAVIPVAGGAFWALHVIWTRRYCAGESAVAMAVWMYTALFAAALVGLAAVPLLQAWLEAVPGTGFATTPWQPVALGSAGLVFLIGLGGITSTACVAQGYRMGPATVMGLFDFSFLFWAPAFAWAIFGETLSQRMALGMVLIVSAGALALWSGARTEASDDLSGSESGGAPGG